MIKIEKKNNQLLLRYTGEGYINAELIDYKFQNDSSVTLQRTFTFKKADLAPVSDADDLLDDVRTFVLAVADDDYYKIDRNILGLKHDLRIWKQVPLKHQTFTAYRNISIFSKIDSLIDEPIVVGGNAVGAIPLADFEELLKNFPTSTELTLYARARVTRVLKDYLETMSDAQKKLDTYLNRTRTIHAASPIKFLQEYESKKFEYVRDELRTMLKCAEGYSEKNWQKLIVGFLLLIFPKYVAVLENLQVKDFYSDPAKVKNRKIDLTLVDADGTIDILEIKKPFANCLISPNKYRDNYIPRKELSGTVMQAEKYIFHLNKWGREGELNILKMRKKELPADFDIKITNPRAIIILGRDVDFANDQKFDFEIIKRKYANITDIMTYDDLLRRLDNIISMIGRNYSKPDARLTSSCA